MTVSKASARAIADLDGGVILATVDIAAPPERVFRSLSDPSELAAWWGSPETYQAEAWEMDLRVGGAWAARGKNAAGQPYAVGGEIVALEAPRRLAYTWKYSWDDSGSTTVSFSLEPIDGGTRVTLRHSGFATTAAGRAACDNHGSGWSMVLGWLRGRAEPAPAKYFFCRLVPPRPDFAMTLSPDERAMMGAHAAYLRAQAELGRLVVAGPVGDPGGPWGLAVWRLADEAELAAATAADPAIQANRGMRYETLPMLSAIAK